LHKEVQTMTSNEQRAEADALARRAEELEALRQAEHESAFSGDQREVTGELSTVDQHPADVADFTYQRELQLTTQGLLDREAAQVDEALRARANGTYGTCQECGQQIPAERLAARPEATLCVDCQSRRESRHPG
jgi:RNA polymerase-binding protein DksA